MRRVLYSGFPVAVMAAFLLGAPIHPAQTKVPTKCLPKVLKHRLAQVEKRFGHVRLISTYRRGARIAGTGRVSKHASCRAIDFKVPRGKHRLAVKWLRKHHSGGVGTYSCAMHHIHIDNGPKLRWHHCVNRNGRPVGRKRGHRS